MAGRRRFGPPSDGGSDRGGSMFGRSGGSSGPPGGRFRRSAAGSSDGRRSRLDAVGGAGRPGSRRGVFAAGGGDDDLYEDGEGLDASQSDLPYDDADRDDGYAGGRDYGDDGGDDDGGDDAGGYGGDDDGSEDDGGGYSGGGDSGYGGDGSGASVASGDRSSGGRLPPLGGSRRPSSSSGGASRLLRLRRGRDAGGPRPRGRRKRKGGPLRRGGRFAMFLASPIGLSAAVFVVFGGLIILMVSSAASVQQQLMSQFFTQPSELSSRAASLGVPSPVDSVPEVLMDAYDASQASFDVPWGAVAAVGRLATDHGRYSPYDDACPSRDVLGSAERARVSLLSALAAFDASPDALSDSSGEGDGGGGDAPLVISVEELEDDGSAGDGSAGDGSAGDGSAGDGGASAVGSLGLSRQEVVERLDSLVLRTSPETLGVSWRGCFVDRDPERGFEMLPGAPAVVPPWDFDPVSGEEVAPPDGFAFDPFWWRWVRVDLADVPLAEGAARGPLMLSGSSVGRDLRNPYDASVEAAERIYFAMEQVTSEFPELSFDMVTFADDPFEADRFWGLVFERVSFVSLLDAVPDGCRSDASSVVQMIDESWRCVLDSASSSDRGVVVVSGLSSELSSDGSPRVMPDRQAVDMVVSEAVRVADMFSGLGEAECSAGALSAGVFPLTAEAAARVGLDDRCDVAGNVLAAAEVFAAAASVPLSERPSGFGSMLAGWDAFPGVLGDVQAAASFASSGPFHGGFGVRGMSSVCRASLSQAAVESLSDPSFPQQRSDFSLWLSGRLFTSSAGCGGVPSEVVLDVLQDVFSAVAEDPQWYVSDGFGGVSEGVVSSRAAELASFIRRELADGRDSLPRARWGSDSAVPRLSHRDLVWPADQASALYEVKGDGSAVEAAVAFMVLYGGTVSDDVRAGVLSAPSVLFSSASMVVPSVEEVAALVEAEAELVASGGVVSASALAEASGVPVGVAGVYLAASQRVAASGGEVSAASVSRELAASAAAPVGVSVGVAVGGILCPIAGPISRQPNDWGAGRSGERRHEGNDVFAAIGTPLVSVRAFTVIAVNRVDTWTPRSSRGLGGLFVSFWDDREDRWYYAHLAPGSIPEHIVPGYSGGAGEFIGRVGVSGNARYTDPHLHIELRPGGGGKVNPYPSLFPACAARRS